MVPKCVLIMTCLCIVAQAARITFPDGVVPNGHENDGEDVPIPDEIQNIDTAKDLSIQELLFEENSASARSCANSLCNNLCVSLGYTLGQCISANVCRCYRFARGTNENDGDDVRIPDEAQNINAAKDLNIQEVLFENKLEGVPASSTSARACTNSLCNNLCWSLGYMWGQCIGANVCRCYRFIRGTDENDGEDVIISDEIQNINAAKDINIQEELFKETSEVAAPSTSARACTNSLCNSLCRSLGYTWGQCISANVCRCYVFTRA